MELALTKAVIDKLLSSDEVLRSVPYFKSVSAFLKEKPNCSKCRQRQSAGEQARTYQTVKLSIQVLPKVQLALIKKVLGVDTLAIFNTKSDGSTTKIIL